MKAKFLIKPLCDLILITPETRAESKRLSRWHNCVLSCKLSPTSDLEKLHMNALLICKETE